MDNARPFAGIEVVEFGQFIAVPFCAQVLSEGGAHVVKVESLEGDPVRQLAPLAPGETRHFISRNRGKHSLPLDLRHRSAAPVVARLPARADVSLLMAALMIQNNNMVRIESADGVAHAAIRARLAELRATGRPYAEQAALTPQIRPPGTVNVYYRTYATRDDAIAVACGSPALRRAFIRAVALTDAALDRPIGHREKELHHYAALRRSVEAALASRTTAEWQATFEAAGIPAAGGKLPLELLDDEQPLANGMLHDLAHPALGRIRVLAPPLSMDGRGFVPAPATSPFGSETRAILGDLGFSSAEVGALLAEGVTREGPPPRG